MKLININSKKGIINLFTDFILNNFDKTKNTILQVTDFNHFFIVNGITDSDTVLDISKIKDDFISKHQNIFEDAGYDKNISIMDLIKYNDKNIKEESLLDTDFYDSNRNLYHSSVINYEFTNNNIYSAHYDNNLVFEINHDYPIFEKGFYKSPIQITSEFPYGYGLSMGRTLLYYSEYIAHNVLSNNLCDKLNIVISTNKNEDNEQKIIISTDEKYNTNDDITSLILDNFDFDFESFNKKLESYDFCDDIKKPTIGKPWLVKDINSIDLTLI